MEPTLLLIDGYAIVFRAYYASAHIPIAAMPDVRAAVTFSRIITKLIKDIETTHRAIVFDTGGSTFREAIYSEYKANRGPAPEILCEQFPLIREIARATDIPTIEKSNYEADDIIATLATTAEQQNIKTIIASQDKDLYQLITDEVILYDPFKKIYLGQEKTKEKFGVEPKLIAELLALAGDASDNIPGIPGIGSKTAAKLLNKYGSLRSLLANSNMIENERHRRLVQENSDIALLSFSLTQLQRTVPLTTAITELENKKMNTTAIAMVIKNHISEWNKAKRERELEVIRDKYGYDKVVNYPYIKNTEDHNKTKMYADIENPSNCMMLHPLGLKDINNNDQVIDQSAIEVVDPVGLKDINNNDQVIDQSAIEVVDKQNNEIVNRSDIVENIDNIIIDKIGLHNTNHLDKSLIVDDKMILQDKIIMESDIAQKECEINAKDVKKNTEYEIYDDIGSGKDEQLYELDRRKSLLSECDESSDMLYNSRLEIVLQNSEDTGILVIRLAMDGQVTNYNLKSIALFGGMSNTVNIELEESDTGSLFDDRKNRGVRPEQLMEQLKNVIENPCVLKVGINIKEIIKLFMQYDIKLDSYDDLTIMHHILNTNSVIDSTMHSYELSDLLLLHRKLKHDIVHNRLCTTYYAIDRPLCRILAEMEMEGIAIDINRLHEISIDLTHKLQKLKEQICILAGTEFNLASPKQTAELLFNKLKLPHSGKNTTTNNETLELLANDGHEIASLIIKWRHINKIKTSYADALPKHINTKTGRIHTSFSNASTSTGRLSSLNPNMQNIPAEDKEIRSTLMAKPGYKLITADYSQIELRVMAHHAQVQNLIKDFNDNKDIHKTAAMRIFNKKADEIEQSMRQKAKTVNFGIIYGITEFGLSRQLHITKTEAKAYIDVYREKYPEIFTYMSNTIEQAKATGVVRTLFGRICHVNINNRNQNQINRIAINAPIQGGGADIIKIAMKKLSLILKEKYPDSKMLLQIHDELVVEVPDNQAEAVSCIIENIMTSAVKLLVPLTVNVTMDRLWRK